MAAQVNVYVPDELKARLDKANLNLSSVARSAWERALGNAGKPGEVHKLEIDARQDEADIIVRFEGEELESGIFRTVNDQAVLVWEEADYSVWEPSDIDRLEDAFAEDVWKRLQEAGRDDMETYSYVLRAFGLTPTIDL